MDTKSISFVIMMSVLGNVLFLVSYYFGPIAPGVAVDFSHVGVFIAAIYGGPVIGLVTGLLAGILPGIFFGPLGMGSWVGLIGLPVGKSLGGLTLGLIFDYFKVNQRSRRSILTAPIVIISYIPEFVFTVFYFISLLPFLVGTGGIGILAFVLPKAFSEIIIIGFLLAALVGNQGFSSFVNSFITRKK